MFEYKVIPAPTKGLKARGIKGTDARYANALQTLMNDLGADGWEYQRADTLPVEERQGLTGKTTTFQNMLVFRRPIQIAETNAPAAALIEDQTEVLGKRSDIKDIAPIEDEKAAPVPPVAPPTPAVGDTPAQAEASDQDAPERKQGEEFSFPWNRRGEAREGDAKDPANAPAKATE